MTIPADAASATLHLWLYPTSTSPAFHSPGAHVQYVLILDENNQRTDTLLWQRSGDRLWIFYQFDLMAFVGQTTELQFGVYNDGGGCVTALYLDDVSVEVCY